MKKLLIISLLLIVQNCYAAQEIIQNHNKISFREKITKELCKPSTQLLLISGVLVGAGILINNSVLPEPESIGYELLTDAAIALPTIVGGYILSARTEEGTCARLQSICGGVGVAFFGEIIQFNALRDCPIFSVNYRSSKNSDDLYSYQCTHPTDDGDEVCGSSCTIAEMSSFFLLVGAGAILRQSMISRVAERNQNELLFDPTNINNRENPLLENLQEQTVQDLLIVDQV